ncbi:ABC transporter ATP-binding protein [Paenibacillus sp. AR247]|uniref:ABC transporter ATP-binding protein n=1 Tax=Paenibacillus sp. AR247 TaxID=1631599 RepID=UPI000CF9688C|nr:ABC transporter ATP-binding protein [Paenibacillus sp. AR247]PQP90388.1 multidrug ABC transporter ATP-binding protein [Paenibacillus sp. AR247]
MNPAAETNKQRPGAANKNNPKGKTPGVTGERFVYQDDEVIEKPFNWSQLTRLFAYMKPYAKQMLPLVLLMMVLGTITKLTVPFLTSQAIDKAIAPKDGNTNLTLLYLLTAGALVLYIIQWIASTYRIRLTNIIGQRVIYDLRSHLFQHIQRLSFNFFDKRPAGSVLVRITNDVNSLQELFTNGVVNLMIDCVQLVGIVVILMLINWKLGLAVVLTVPIMFFISTKLRVKIRRAWQEVRNVKAGQTIALVGHTGSGKSTIINLLSRFYDITGGKITIDGLDIRDVKLDTLRSQIGIVLQDTFIFSGTIRDNIRFGRLDAADEEIEEVAKAVDAHEFIMKLPNGYDTEVEERGNMLSMGQRQLLSFARALLADPRILILDEATASIDTETELKIQEALKVLLKERTSFIVAHRLSTIRHADKIVVLDHGEIKEEGNHQELMQKQGTYHGLIEAQFRFV